MFHIECIHDKKPPQFAPVTAAEIEALIARHPFYLGPYYAGRWEYYKEVINLVLGILPNVKTILELGPYNLPLIKGADTMDIDPDIPNLTYCHDASMSPWPIVDGKYDLFIGLQVWEHLKDKQTEAFHEVMRISRMAVLSFPYKWDRPGNCHHGIDDSVIEKWTAGVKARKRILANKRIICFYDFETDVRRR